MNGVLADPCPTVWDRLWQHVPTAERDQRDLAREAASPRWERFTAALTTHLGSIAGLRSVELGSGRGDISVLLAQHGAQVTLVDLSALVLDQARQRFERLGLRVECVQANLMDLPTSLKGQFDVAVSLGVVEHFEAEERTCALAGHADALREGGIAMISVPHAACVPYRLWKRYLEWRGWWPYGKEIPYFKGEMKRRAAAAGLRPVDVFAYGWWQSVGDHWGRSVLHRSWDFSDKRSVLDNCAGANLVYIGLHTDCSGKAKHAGKDARLCASSS